MINIHIHQPIVNICFTILITNRLNSFQKLLTTLTFLHLENVCLIWLLNDLRELMFWQKIIAIYTEIYRHAKENRKMPMRLKLNKF